MVRAVEIHDREPLHRLFVAAGLGDVSDPAVELGRVAGHLDERRVGAAVSGPAPLVGSDRETLASDLAPALDVVEVAADG